MYLLLFAFLLFIKFFLWFRKQLQQEFLDHGVLTLLKNWLEPLPDGSLPNINIRAAILKILNDVRAVLYLLGLISFSKSLGMLCST